MRIVQRAAHLLGVDLLSAAYTERGIMQYQSAEVSGEKHLIQHVLPQIVSRHAPVMFDVGANRGEYSLMLLSAFPSAHLHAFEPNPAAFAALCDAVRAKGVRCYNLGLSNIPGTGALYLYPDDPLTEHATAYRDVMVSLHDCKAPAKVDIEFRTVDDLCADESIDHIDFMKIDTEGHELAVLQGAKHMLASGRIAAIQFEFNEMNVISRTFLRDFFEMMPSFRFFRLARAGLLPVPTYSPKLEVFQFQNYLAVLRDITLG